jgi:hypothetical protein
MTSKNWTWNPLIAPSVSEYFEFTAWQSMQRTKFTPGGVVQQMIALSASPLLFVIESGRILVAIASESVSNGVNAAIASAASLDHVFHQGPKVYSRYSVTSPGVEFPVTTELPETDVRFVILAPNPPTFLASSIINALADFGEDRPVNYLLTLDQISGDVRYFEVASVDPVSIITSNGGTVRVAVESQ